MNHTANMHINAVDLRTRDWNVIFENDRTICKRHGTITVYENL